MEDMIGKVRQLKKQLENHPDEDRVIIIFEKLERMQMTLDILQSTGIGKTVNGFRKVDGFVGCEAKSLVSKWKKLVSGGHNTSGPPDKSKEQNHEGPNNIKKIVVKTEKDSHHKPVSSSKEQGSCTSSRSSHTQSPGYRQIQTEKEYDPQKSTIKEEPVSNNFHSDIVRIKQERYDIEVSNSSNSKYREGSDFDMLRHNVKHENSHTSYSVKRHKHHKHNRDREQKKGKSRPESEENTQVPINSEVTEEGDEHYHNDGETLKAIIKTEKSDSSIDIAKIKQERKENTFHKNTEGHSKHKSSSQSSSSSEKIDKESKIPKNEAKNNVSNHIDEEEDNGMSFDDFLNYDVPRHKKSSVEKGNANTSHSKHPTCKDRDKSKHSSSSSVASSSRSTNKDSQHKSKHHSKHEKQHQQHSGGKKHKSSHSSKDKGKHSRSSSSADKIVKKRKQELHIDIPEPPPKQVKLCPADVMSTLPEIQPNYKPLPYLDIDLRGRNAQTLHDEGAAGMKKNTRTMVYSGKRNIFLTSVPTLYEACMRVLMDNIDALDYVGGVPYDILKPVLLKCSPEQLYHLEDVNPHFLEDSDELWQILANRDFRGCHPTDMESWRELYLRKHDEREAKLHKLTASIQAKTIAAKAPVKKCKLAYVDSMAKPPREVRRAQMRHGTAGPMGKQDPLAKLTTHGGGKTQAKPPIFSNPDSSHRREQKVVRRVAPMMQKTLSFMKKLQRR